MEKNYYNPKVGFHGITQTYHKNKGKVKLKQIEDYLKKQETYQIHKQPNIPRKFFPITASRKNQTWQADLLDVSQISNTNKAVKYLLVCIDVYTRYAWVRPLTAKTGDKVMKAFESIFKEAKPDVIMVDQGTEFVNNTLEKKLEEEGIFLWLSPAGEKRKQAIVERFNRTLRGLMTKYMTAYKTDKYIDVLDDLVYNYNHTPHRGLGYSTPIKPDAAKIEALYQQKELAAEKYFQPLQVGQKVRVMRNKRAFEKGAAANFGATVHKIEEAQGRSYRIGDNWHMYYQLLPVEKVEKFKPPEKEEANDEIDDFEKLPKQTRTTLKKDKLSLNNVVKEKRQPKKKVYDDDFVYG